ncbi:MAG: hypothetical protein IIT66_03835, partial [Acetobacter sp.]|nr:hypothetical protein [Acetobacter sp.]
FETRLILLNQNTSLAVVLVLLGVFLWGYSLGSPFQCHAQTFSSVGILSQQNGDNSNTIDQTMTANVCNSSSPHAPKSSFDR